MSARAVFDVRVHVTGDTAGHVWDLIRDFQEAAANVAPRGVDVRYSQLRPAGRSRTFDATMSPARRRKAA